MNFSLTNAPPTFCWMGLHVFKPLTDKYPEDCDYYMDDFGIMTDDSPEEIEKHRKITEQFLQICERFSLFLKPEKCIFEQKEMDFLGYHVKDGELSIDPTKLAGIRDYTETLDNVKEVRKFLGIVGYQRQFIRDFAKTARPLHQLTKKDTPFRWMDEHTEAVQTLKRAVTEDPVIKPPDQTRQFELETDASKHATGAILYQREPDPKDTIDDQGIPICKGKRHVIGYHSQAFSQAEQNYPIYDREYLGVLRGLRHCRHLLINTPPEQPVLVYTDHANLQYYRDPHRLPTRVHRWNAELADYNIKIIYKPGKTNHADALSRRPDYTQGEEENPEITTLDDEKFDSDTEERRQLGAEINGIKEEPDVNYELDYKVLKGQKENPEIIERWTTAHNLTEEDGHSL